MYAIP
ncbi:simple sugar transport system ATP-binding protein, partial [Candidatus Hakubella thermalkaliphila]